MSIAFGPRLQYERRKRNLTQKALGELAEMDPGHISKIESGSIHRPTDAVILRLARALELDDAETAALLASIDQPRQDHPVLLTVEDLTRKIDQVHWDQNRVDAMVLILDGWILLDRWKRRPLQRRFWEAGRE